MANTILTKPTRSSNIRSNSQVQAYIKNSKSGYEIWKVEKVSLFGSFPDQAVAQRIMIETFGQEEGTITTPIASPPPKRRGPAPGSKRKAATTPSENGTVKKKGGRPKGSKNKPKDSDLSTTVQSYVEDSTTDTVTVWPEVVIADTTASNGFDQESHDDFEIPETHSNDTEEKQTTRIGSNW